MSWNYAELSKTAKENGGPEKLIECFVEHGKELRTKEITHAWAISIFATAAVTAAATLGLSKLYARFSSKQKEKENFEEAKETFINKVNEYDKIVSCEEIAIDEVTDTESIEAQ